MDLNMQMKSADVMVRFLRHDLAHISKVPYYPQKTAFEYKPDPCPLPRSTPEAQGMNSAAVERLIRGMDAAAAVAPHGMMILRHGYVAAEAYWKPYRADVPHMLYSMSKTITGTAVGMAADEGLLSPDELLTDIFKEKLPPVTAPGIRKMTLRNLLNMSAGVRFNEVGSALFEDWRRMYLESIPKFEPGTEFAYNSMNSYMLAAALKQKTGMSLTEFLTPRLFEPLGIACHPWETCPEGVEKGGWGLSLRLEDAAKIGLLYLNRGVWKAGGQERRLLSEEWIREATRAQIGTPNGECRKGYGYQLWLSPIEGAYQFNGAFGQYVLVLPQYDAVVAVTGGAANLFSGSPLAELIRGLFEEGCSVRPLPEDKPAQESLRKTVAGLTLNALPPLEGACKEESRFAQDVAETLCGREYRAEDNIAGLFPLILQCVHSNFTAGVDRIRFEREEGGVSMIVYEGNEGNRLRLRPGEQFCLQRLSKGGEEQLCGVRTEWRRDADGAVALRVTISFMETPNTRVITALLKEDGAEFAFDELPEVSAAAVMLAELTGMSLTGFLRKLLPELKKRKRGGRKLREIIAPQFKASPVKIYREPPSC